MSICRSDGVSPLYIASQNGHKEVSLLLQMVPLCQNLTMMVCHHYWFHQINGHTNVVSMLL